jgi:hypothetical protein
VLEPAAALYQAAGESEAVARVLTQLVLAHARGGTAAEGRC